MSYLEKDFQTDFNKWCKHLFPYHAAFELKATKQSSLPFTAVKPHQEAALFNVKHGTFVFKIPDTGNVQNPFDSFLFKNAPAFVVIMFNSKSHDFVMIDIDVWMEEKKVSQRKSLLDSRAREIGYVCTLSHALQLPHTLRTFLYDAYASNMSLLQLDKVT